MRSRKFSHILKSFLCFPFIMGVFMIPATSKEYVFKSEFVFDYVEGSNAWVIDKYDDDVATGSVVLQFGASLNQRLEFDTGNDWFTFNNDVNVGGDVNADGSAIIIDYDDTVIAGDIGLQFGSTLGRTLSYDVTNNQFEFDDTVNIGGELEITGNTVTLDYDNSGGDISLLFGQSLGESFIWDDSESNFNVSNDLVVAGDLGIGTNPTTNLTLFDNTSTLAHEYINLDNGTDVVTILTGTQDPTSVATIGDSGSLFLNTDTGVLYTKQDDGVTVNWLPASLDPGIYDALTGTFGTPGVTNKFVTDSDPRLAGTSGTFGETSLGTRLDYTSENIIDRTEIWYTRIFLPANSTVTSMGVFTTQAKNGNVRFGLYSDNNGPDAKLAETAVISGPSPVDQFWEGNLTAVYNVTTAGYYWTAMATSANPQAQTTTDAEDVFISYRVESKGAGVTTLPATAAPEPTSNTSRFLPYIVAFE